ncbi:MAG: response regulator, partial [Desulfobacterium sp.]|nr:response regulator [Desulfobacterium sp.]MBU4035764.1 response regulator [Pseudomonadota bacterium]
MSDIRILVVDDEEDITELIRYNLVSDGYTVKCAYSGEEAVKIAMSEPFDLIVLDLMLPRIGGIDVAKRLRSDQKTINIPIIMLTAKSEEADVLSGLELADDYVTKPFSPKILSARISAVLRRKIDASTDSYDDKIIIRGDIQIHTGRRRVEVCGEPVELSFSEFQI